MGKGGRSSTEMASRIADLRADLTKAKDLSQSNLAAEIRKMGFSCLACGECCRGEDNSVLVFPREIRRIQEATGLSWQEAAEPPEEGEWDTEGHFHTLEWRLAKVGEACRFYQEGRCTIYSVRPMLCRTYPFYLDDCALRCSECRGLLEHGLEKRRTCPLEPKPTCKNCRIHCYSREYRAKIREIMAFSGRKMILRGRLDYLWHYFF